MDFTFHVITLIGLLFVASIIAGGLSPRFGVPTLLIFVGLGMLAGEDGLGGIQYDDIQSAHLAGTLALAVILFDGGLRTDIASFRSGLRPAILLATLGVLLTAAITGAAAIWLLGLSPIEAMLLGAIVSSTDAAAVFSLLKQANLSLHPGVGKALEIESGTNDPMAVFLTILLIEAILKGGFSSSQVLLTFFSQMGLGLLGGIGGGYLLARLINRIELGPSLYPLLALFGALLIFGIVSELNGSGFLAVYIVGLTIGNTRLRSANSILNFSDGIAWLAQIGMFLILGLLVTPTELIRYALPASIIATALILVARPAAVVACLTPLGFGWREQTYISWVGLRGAVPIVLAMFPLLAGIESARPIFNVAFFVVLISLIVQGMTIAPAARWLRLDVRREAPQRHRVELDVPGQTNYEVVGYPVQKDSGVAGQTLVNLPLPGSVRVAGIMRRGALAPISNRLKLRPGDHVYLLTPMKYVERLDQIFLSRHGGDRRHYVVGDFDVSGQASVYELLLLLGLDASEVPTDETVQTLFEKRFGAVEEQQSIALGPYLLTSQQVEKGHVISARLQEESEDPG